MDLMWVTTPRESALEIEFYLCRVCVGVVIPETFDKASIAWSSRISNHDSVVGIAFATVTLQSDSCRHKFELIIDLNIPLSRNGGAKVII